MRYQWKLNGSLVIAADRRHRIKTRSDLHLRETTSSRAYVGDLRGRSIFWSCQSFRLSDFEFKAKDFDGYGENWPISLADLAPYYERVEEMYQVTGRPEGLPQYPDSKFVAVTNAPDSPFLRHLSPRVRQHHGGDVAPSRESRSHQSERKRSVGNSCAAHLRGVR